MTNTPRSPMSAPLNYFAVMLFFSASFAVAQEAAKKDSIWVAECNGLQFRFDRATRKAVVKLKTTGVTIDLCEGKIGFDNGVALRAPMSPKDDSPAGPVGEVGLNRSRNIVYVLSRHPDTGKKKDGVFCETPITVE